MVNLNPGQMVVNVEQDKDARHDYRFSLADILPPGDLLANVTWAQSDGILLDRQSFNATDVALRVAGGLPGQWYSMTATFQTASGVIDQFVVRVFVKADAEVLGDLGSALFPNKYTAVEQMQRDGLMLAAQNHFGGAALSGPYIWSKLQAAEADAERRLKVFFGPVKVIPDDAPGDEVQALEAAGTRYVQEAAFDYEAGMFLPDEYGMLALGHRPLISVESVQIAMPSPFLQSFAVPPDWLRMDKRAGIVRFFPTTTALGVPAAVVGMGAWSGSSYPNAIRVRYTSGLKNAARDYPDLVDVVKKMAVLRIIEDTFIPSSGSISADGLSQSQSFDVSEYKDAIDRALFGPKGSNGGLYTAIHGMTFGVV